MPTRTLALALAGFALGALPLLASDGVIEINQARALAGGVVPGDAPGFPVTIPAPGSYILTSNLDLSGLPSPESLTAIEVAGGLPSSFAFASIDLNGFSVIGTGAGIAEGAGKGIVGSAARVHNGTILRMGNNGIDLLYGIVEDVDASENGGSGIRVIWGTVSNCTAYDNGDAGIDGAAGLAVADSVAGANDSDGIRAGRIERSIAINNVGAGFFPYASLAHSAAFGNATPLKCDTTCALTANQLAGCGPTLVSCVTGSGTSVQVPADSNLCGTSLCS